MEHAIVQDNQWIQIVPVAICIVILGAHMNVLFIFKVKILVFIKRSIRFPPSCQVLNIDWSVYFDHVVQFSSLFGADS